MNEEKDTVTSESALKALTEILSERDADIPESAKQNRGVCNFRSAGKSSCLNMTKSECDLFDGSWSAGGKCSPKYPNEGTCKAGIQ